MRESSFREVYFLCLIVWCLTGLYSDVECYPQIDCEEDEDYRQSSAVQSSLCGLMWGDQKKIQNVFKRFLFHYSKAHNSVGTVERQSHSVHPLMRLSPKFTLRRKKQQLLSRY
ncbi:neuromedin-S isoform X2 [Hemibagrus wyckioides]|uniref:neuromedin-S isoform X2 n=1 Tax=Hemibagrus wyckioides TaxID=337641 RepID=UPI00266D6EC0|nr:neuromedin-S isoform X2 [Hemibagrus wyckioides]